MKIVKYLLLGACITTVSASFADSKPAWSFTMNRTYTCPGISPITVQNMLDPKLYSTIAEHLHTMTKMPTEYKCTFKSTGSSYQSSRHTIFDSTGFLILKNPSVAGNEKSGYILMADKLIQDSTDTGKGNGPQWEMSSSGKNHTEISKFNSLKNTRLF